MRPYEAEDDYWLIRQFLREVMRLNGLREWSWSVPRLDYWRWHCIENCRSCDSVERVTYLWETPQGQLVAVLNPEETGQVFLQVHPAHKRRELEQEMLAVAEAHLAAEREEGRSIAIWADSEDLIRQGILKERGYAQAGEVESQWRRDLDGPIPQVPVAEGYVVRSLGDQGEIPARSWASWRGFHPDQPDEKYEGWEWYRNIQRCPLYRRDLDIVAAAPGGSIAAFATCWYDDATRTACIEPVATVPEHQRRGLARAVITEGLRRLQCMGAQRAFIGGYAPGPNALYASVLSPECDRSEQWVKRW
jgi:ribosomal protein S18 acetylase RimI-like enzyme